ncbi:MAG: hypothetical protein DMG65_19575 [Candidatus Angelobacter sp. Gp1-AA117]|nr:MAG: hypothetical protein DMG65_19575 [Candidatus Angelobacter sp. Gp1-AA117]
MAKKNEFARVIRQVRVMTGEARRLRETGIRLLIRHRFWQRGECLPGEEVLGVWVIYRRREFAVPLSLRLRLLTDFLAAHRHVGQSAGQIAARMNIDEFYRRHGTNAKTKALMSSGMSRTAIKQQMMRLRLGFRLALKEARLSIDPTKIVISESTTMNEVRYRLKASVRWQHSEL